MLRERYVRVLWQLKDFRIDDLFGWTMQWMTQVHCTVLYCNTITDHSPFVRRLREEKSDWTCTSRHQSTPSWWSIYKFNEIHDDPFSEMESWGQIQKDKSFDTYSIRATQNRFGITWPYMKWLHDVAWLSILKGLWTWLCVTLIEHGILVTDVTCSLFKISISLLQPLLEKIMKSKPLVRRAAGNLRLASLLSIQLGTRYIWLGNCH